MKTWFISDTHFGHENIIKYCNRPFKNVTDMDDTIIYNWNSLVGNEDTVFHLGDFCFGNSKIASNYFKRLNGNIYILIDQSHHDASWMDKYFVIDERYTSASGSYVLTCPPIYTLDLDEYSVDGYKKSIVLCHYPIYVWNKKHYLSWHLYGHIHNKDFFIPDSPLSMNVGVDCNDFKPVSLDTIADRFLMIEGLIRR